jgi:non-homologous end joining protein Ku
LILKAEMALFSNAASTKSIQVNVPVNIILATADSTVKFNFFNKIIN